MKNMSIVRPKTLLAAGLAVVSYASTHAYAQDLGVPSATGAHQERDATSDAPAVTLEQVLVTGSHIRDTATSRSSPTIVFDKEAIDRTGVATMQQFFEKLPQNFGGGANGANVANLGLDRDRGSNFGQGTSINLRGLGTGTTLTLVNGHRVSSSNRYQYVDMSLIPLSAVERVEILTDGASAIYGADAVGGVVNIILRRDFTGYETSVRYGTVTAGNMDEYQASQATGWSWDGGHLMASYEFLKQDNLSATDKDFSEKVTVKPYDLYPGSKRHSVYVDGVQQINDVLTFNVSGSFSKRDMDTTISNSSDDTRLFPSTEQFDLFAGLTLDLPHQWQARLNSGSGKSDVRYERTTISGGSATTALPTNMNSDTRYLELVADGDLFTFPAGDVRAAFGASYRRESYDFHDARGLEAAFDQSRNIRSAFTELNIPLLKDLPGVRSLWLTAAARYDDYSDFGSTTNPKFGLLWEATEGLSFRTSYGRSYRAPVYQDMLPNNTVVAGNVPNPNAPSGRTILMMISNGNPDLDPERAKTWTGGFSFAPPSIPGLKLDASYYHIDYDDRMDTGYGGSYPSLFLSSTEPYADILTFNPTSEQIQAVRQLGLSGNGLYVSRAGPYAIPGDRDETDTEVILDNRVRNVAFTKQRGVDFNAAYSVDAGESNIALNLAGQYIIESKRRVTGTAPLADAVNLLYRPVDLNVRGGVALTRRNVAGGLFVNYVDSYHDPSNATDPHIDSWTTVDLNLKYSFTAGSQDGTSLALNVQNLFDRAPPFVVNSINSGFDPTNATALGRFVSLTLTHRW
ncbi:TonB-dependent receptor plug domain-containing protein [Xanthomonas theicola]|uniref:TonB-dependent receptor n=1 Tax=Xanthomonas theicola TaxID=56464 RepID=A0A2S6ZBM4_9XANT|nr:TonB-dependent receptor [Xanthomonas theicola]PPT84622.1 TonB-dependent receptor [Xanthomonas theicola]QNH24654.1 TonB-dependent receptor [Xanthomonas theicola]